MEIKKLTKEEKLEGLTLDFVNKVNLKQRSSPVMFKQGDEPVSLMECSTGYWVNTSDGFLKDEKGKLIVAKIRECHIARARYLFYHVDEEKQIEAEKVLRKRKEKIQEKLSIFKKNIEILKASLDKSSSASSLVQILESMMTEEQKKSTQAENDRKVAMLPEMESQYALLVSEFEKGNRNYLLNVLGIEKIENPVSFKIENEDDMRMMRNAFGKKAIDDSEGDVNKLYARLKVEQQSKI